MKYYTIFFGNHLWTTCIDDMNTTEVWSNGGMLWIDEKQAIKYLKHIKKYDFEEEDSKFRIVKIII